MKEMINKTKKSKRNQSGLSALAAVACTAAILVAAAALAVSCARRIPEETERETTTEAPVTEYEGPEASLTLLSSPVRTLYFEGEALDPTGVSLLASIDGSDETVDGAEAYRPFMKAGDTETVLIYKKGTVSIPVTVVPGRGSDFESTVSQKKYDGMIKDYAKKNRQVSNTWYDGLGSGNRLDNPAPDGCVYSLQELADYVDYHAFYHIGRIVVKPVFEWKGKTDLLRDLYYRSGLIASNASVDMTELQDGYILIALKYYDETLLISADDGSAIPEMLLPETGASGMRDGRFVPDAIDLENGIAVNNSEQLCWALTRGYKVAPAAGSAAEALAGRACEVLGTVCGDGMGPFEKMYAVYSWFLKNTKYDFSGEEWAGKSLDPERESDMFGAVLASFHAEGPLIYGSGVCYGFAKSYAILLSLEGLDVRRVNGHESGTFGWSAFVKDPVSGFEDSLTSHSYVFVRVDGQDYLSDVTYAFAGTVSPGGVRTCWYRDMALALTKEEHSKVYKDMTDLYSSSPDYVPASHNYLKEMKYDGTHSLFCSNQPEWDSYLSYIGERIRNSSGRTVYFNATVRNYASYEILRNSLQLFLQKTGRKYSLAAEERSFPDETYYCFITVLS